MDIGKTIAEWRSAADMSQQALADRLLVSRELVSKWENGTRRPDYRMIEQIAGVFRVSADQLVNQNDLIFRELSECVPEGNEMTEEQLSEAVSGFLLKLPEKEANVFMKRYYFLKTAAEIAAEYGMGENHVRSMLSKTRKKLKKQIGRCGYERNETV